MADLIAALVVAVFLVKQQRVGAAFRNTDAVIVAVYRGEVADEEKILFLCFIAADKAENTAVSVVGVDPLEAVMEEGKGKKPSPSARAQAPAGLRETPIGSTAAPPGSAARLVPSFSFRIILPK